MKRTNYMLFYLCALIAASSFISCKSNEGGVSVSPFAPSQVRLEDSWVKDREVLSTDFLMRLDPDRLLHNFRINAGLESAAKPLGGWEEPWCGLRGHFTGHYLSALSMLVGRYGDGDMAERLDYMVDELEKCQMALGENGYLSAFPERDVEHIETYFTGAWA